MHDRVERTDRPKDTGSGTATRRPRPNLFLIGGPRSGSRSLYLYLKGHPRIFMSRVKEPCFFCEDLPGLSKFDGEADYLRSFGCANERHIAIGEASTWYLCSRAAPLRLHSFDPRARIIALIRNPIDVVQSLHGLFRLIGWEDEPDLGRALRLEGRRRAGEALPRQCPTPEVVQYTRIARHGENLERWLSLFPEEQICPVVFDDFVAYPGDTYRRILEFIGVPDDGRTHFPHSNERRAPRRGALARVFRDPPPTIRPVGRAARRALRAMGVNDHALMRRLRILASRRESRPAVGPDVRRRLTEEFASDVRHLSELLGRDLSAWLDTPSPVASPERL